AFGLPVAVEIALAVAQHRVVLGMLEHNGERDRLERRERSSCAVLRPHGEEELARLVARGIEHQRALGSTFFAGPGASFANLRRSGNSHWSKMGHFQHSGFFATQV